jgi:hypothetical protein
MKFLHLLLYVGFVFLLVVGYLYMVGEI